MQVLDQAAGNKTFLDAILAPPILTGVGKTSANIFVDGNNSRVSFLKLVFVVVDIFAVFTSMAPSKESLSL